MAQNNRFARQNEQNSAKRNLTGEEIISVDARLVRLEEDIRRLKIEYDIFFNGGSKRAPYDTKNRVETVLKRLGDERSLTFAQRYQYNALMARYNSFKELWRRTMKGREEGRDAATLAKAALAEETEDAATAPQAERKSSFVCSDVNHETATVQKLYKALIDAKAACGESTSELLFVDFQKKLAAQTESFKQQKGCERVSFTVTTENGRVVFKARPEE